MDRTIKTKSKHNSSEVLCINLSYKKTDLNGLISAFNFSLVLWTAVGSHRDSFSVSEGAGTSEICLYSPEGINSLFSLRNPVNQQLG